MKKMIISTENAPAAIGAYSQAVMAGGVLYTSGQLGLVPATGSLAGDDIKSQSEQALLNLKAIVLAAGFTMDDVVKTTVFLSDIAQFSEFNDVYSSFFSQNPPARSCVAVKALPKNALVEIELVASK
jgi:2-iminobutanoate/2-iminopropanoate deaminase